MSSNDTIIHLIAGGIGGITAAVVTCPLEVVKTRLQSTVAVFHNGVTPPVLSLSRSPDLKLIPLNSRAARPSIWGCLKYIVENEGPKALFKGLGPNLLGFAPASTYSRAKKFFNKSFRPDTPQVHVCSAVCAGVITATATNPIWFVKTRLQLDQRKNGGLTTRQCIYNIYKNKGIVGFYKGITASYIGVSESVIYFVLYEAIKAKLHHYRNGNTKKKKTTRDFLDYMIAGAFSKICASAVAYPHEVARTRLRQEGDKYKSFFQTLATTFREEGTRGLYRGLSTQMVKQIPSTAIMMSTYEAVVHILSS